MCLIQVPNLKNHVNIKDNSITTLFLVLFKKRFKLAVLVWLLKFTYFKINVYSVQSNNLSTCHTAVP